MSASARPAPPFFGNTVVWATLLLAVLGWGLGFYGPSVFLHAVTERTGWPVGFVSGFISLHFLFGALVITRLGACYARWGIPRVTRTGSLALALGVLGWALAATPCQLAVAAALTGSGWVTMSATAINAIVSPWFVRRRAAALSAAYNGSSIGGAVFSPVWAMLIPFLTFPVAAALLGSLSVATVWFLSGRVFSKTPAGMGLLPDGAAAAPETAAPKDPAPSFALSGRELLRNKVFLSLAAGMALGLFAQVGLFAHLYSVLVPSFGRELSGFALTLATVCAITGRTAVANRISPKTNRRLVGCVNYGMQAFGSLLLCFAGGSQTMLLAGIVFFGLGIGNSTSLTPLIAQQEFADRDVARVVPLCIAFSQAAYAFSPAFFGLLRTAPDGLGLMLLFGGAAVIQILAMLCFFAGRPGATPSKTPEMSAGRTTQ